VVAEEEEEEEDLIDPVTGLSIDRQPIQRKIAIIAGTGKAMIFDNSFL